MKRGFTMVELMCVLCVSAVLLGVLFPCLGLASEGARRAKCGNNLRQLGLATTLYVTDCDGWLPSAEPRRREPASPLHWFMNDQLMECVGMPLTYDDEGALVGPAGGKESVLTCPSDAHPMDTRPADHVASERREYGLSYGMNGTFGVGGRPDHVAYRRYSEFRNPSRTCLLADCWGTSQGPGIVLYHSCVQDNLADRHRGFVNVAFLDGHVQAVRHEEIPMGFERRHEPFWSAKDP